MGLCWGGLELGPWRHYRAVAARYEAAAFRCFELQVKANRPGACAASSVCTTQQSRPSCCLQGALLSEFLAGPLHISSLTCALPWGASSGAQNLPQPHHSSGQEASAVQQRTCQAAPAALPQQQGNAAQQDSVMMRAATEALLRAVSGQCRVQAGHSNS